MMMMACKVHLTVHTEHFVEMQHVKINMQNSDEFQTGSVMDKNKIGKRCALTLNLLVGRSY